MSPEIENYHHNLEPSDKDICDLLFQIINEQLPNTTNKIWHAHPVWFDNGNPLVGYDKLKNGVRVLFWSGQSFDEPELQNEGKFKAAEMRYTDVHQINPEQVKRWVQKSALIQWDYKNIVKRKGVLERLK